MEYEKTPPPMPVPQYKRSMTGSVGVMPPPLPPEGVFNVWWKALVGIVTGLAAIGVVTWVIAKQFFVTRDEWVAQSTKLNDIAYQVTQIQRSVGDMTAEIKEVSQIVQALNIRLIQMEAVQPPRRR